MNNEKNTITVSDWVFAIACSSIAVDNERALRDNAIIALREKGFNAVQENKKGTAKHFKPLLENEVSYTVCEEMALLAFEAKKLVYSDEQRKGAVKNFRLSLTFALETGVWTNNVGRYKESLAKQKHTQIEAQLAINNAGKNAIDAAIKAGTLKEIKGKGKKGATTPKPFDVVKICAALHDKYNDETVEEIILELQRLMSM